MTESLYSQTSCKIMSNATKVITTLIMCTYRKLIHRNGKCSRFPVVLLFDNMASNAASAQNPGENPESNIYIWWSNGADTMAI